MHPEPRAGGGTAEGATPQPGAPGFWERVQAFRERHPKKELALFFSAGFIFDVLTLDRIDSDATILSHAGYLVVLGLLLLYEQRHVAGLARPPKLIAKVWQFHEDILHFLLGSLLSAFSLFYFKAASGIAGPIFMAVMFALLIGNELPRLRRLGHVVRVGLYGLCVATFFSYFLPILFGFLSPFLFLLALLASFGVGYGMYRLVRWWSQDAKQARERLLIPFAAVLAAFGALYFARVLPPLPLAIQKIGIYHELEKATDEAGRPVFVLRHQRPWWRFWSKGDQTFRKRPGDKVNVFAAVFAPARFQDKLRIQWQKRHPKTGWADWGRPVVVSLTGGREQGFRTWAYLTDPQPGDYRAYVLTDDARTIGSIGVSVVEDASSEPRVLLEERY